MEVRNQKGPIVALLKGVSANPNEQIHQDLNEYKSNLCVCVCVCVRARAAEEMAVDMRHLLSMFAPV